MTSQPSNFAYELNASATTENGAVSLATPDPSGESSGRLSLFFKSVRGLNSPAHYQYMTEASHESVIDAFLMTFHTRDCRGGKGERDLGRRGLVWLFINYPHLFSKVVKLIPEYGRWDDLLQFFPGVLDLSDIGFVRANYVSTVLDSNSMIVLRTLQTQIVQLLGRNLKEDLNNMTQGKPCSLAAKWAPTEGDSLDRESGVFKSLATEMKVSTRILRKEYLTPLRSYIKIVERFMCDREWDEIDYNKVPSCAMKRLKKSFEKHDETRFQKWRNALQKGDPTIAKVNAKQLQPHELVNEMRCSGHADDVCAAQWKIMEDECIKNGALSNDIAVVDTSSSMHSPNYLPYDVACAMGLLISKCSVGKFKNHVLTFNSTPAFVIIKDVPIYDRWYQLSNISWGGSTNIQYTFELILARGKECKLSQEDMPKRLWIISDMQFNAVNYKGSVTNFESIDKMYAESGYTRPQIVFWNVDGTSSDFPVSVGDHGTAMISGFSPSVMKAVLKGDDRFSPYGIMRECLDDDRLLPVRIALGVEMLGEKK
jgi:hypothetical protein